MESPLFTRYVCGELVAVLHSTAFGRIGNAFGAQPSPTFVTSAATSGRPVAAPALSAQLVSSWNVCSSSAPVPTSAKSSEHALMIALRASFALSFESMKSTWILRPPMPPLALAYFPYPFTPSTMPCSTPGTIGLSTSSTTAMRIVVGVIPTSLAVLPDLDCASAGAPDNAVPTSARTATNAMRNGLRMESPSCWQVDARGILAHFADPLSSA